MRGGLRLPIDADRPADAQATGRAGGLQLLVEPLRREGVLVQAAGALPKPALRLEGAGRAAIAIQRRGGALDAEHPSRDVMDAINRLESDAARARQRHIDHLERPPTLGAAASVLNDRADDDTDRGVLAVVNQQHIAAGSRKLPRVPTNKRATHQDRQNLRAAPRGVSGQSWTTHRGVSDQVIDRFGSSA